MSTSNLDRSAGLFEDIAPEAWRQGADLALDLYYREPDDEACLEAEYREGRPQNNIVWRSLCKARESGDPQIEKAFCAVLSHFVILAAELTQTDLEELTARPVAQAVLP